MAQDTPPRYPRAFEYTPRPGEREGGRRREKERGRREGERRKREGRKLKQPTAEDVIKLLYNVCPLMCANITMQM